MGKFDSVRTEDRTILASAERSATNSSEIQNNDSARGVLVVLNVTEVTDATNEVQSLLVDATAGTYTLTFGADTTGALAYNADAATVETALRALTSVGGANVSVAPAGPGMTITFNGALAAQNVAQITADSSSLTGNTATASVITTTQGSAATSLTLSVTGTDPASGASVTLLTGAAVTSISTNSYRIYPGLTAVANATASDVLPKTWKVTVTHGGSVASTYSVGACLLA